MRTPKELDTLIRTKARVDYYAKIDAAWQNFCTAVRTSRGAYSEVLNKQGGEMVEALKIESKSAVEQDAVELFLKQFEQFGQQIADLEHRQFD